MRLWLMWLNEAKERTHGKADHHRYAIGCASCRNKDVLLTIVSIEVEYENVPMHGE